MKKILAIIRPNLMSVFSVYYPKGTSILTQLRVGLSTLNYHEFENNFRDTLNPLCLINNGIENLEQYILHCQSYCTIRRHLLTCINNILNPYAFKI